MTSRTMKAIVLRQILITISNVHIILTDVDKYILFTLQQRKNAQSYLQVDLLQAQVFEENLHACWNGSTRYISISYVSYNFSAFI